MTVKFSGLESAPNTLHRKGEGCGLRSHGSQTQSFSLFSYKWVLKTGSEISVCQFSSLQKWATKLDCDLHCHGLPLDLVVLQRNRSAAREEEVSVKKGLVPQVWRGERSWVHKVTHLMFLCKWPVVIFTCVCVCSFQHTDIWGEKYYYFK